MKVGWWPLCTVIVVAIAVIAEDTKDTSLDPEVLDQWSIYKLKYHKHYADPLENDKRLQIFADNLQKIDAHNRAYARGETNSTEGLNDMSDMTLKEIQDIRLESL